MPHTSYYLTLTVLMFYYTIIVTFRVLIQQGFLSEPFFIFPNFSHSVKKTTPKTTKKKVKKRHNPSTIKKSKLPIQKKKQPKKKSIILQIKNKFAIIGKPSRNQLIIISIISFTAYFISNSMETLIITFLYLCLIYAVSLIYLAYVETKEENERLKQEVLNARKRRKKKKQLKKTN